MKTVILAFALIAPLAPVSIHALSVIPVKTAKSSPAAQPNYGKLPLSFQPNRGQAEARVKFTASGKGYSLHLTPSGAILSLSNAPPASPSPRPQAPQASSPQRLSNPADVIGMTLTGANSHSSLTGDDPLPGKVNYFLGSDPSRWLANVPTYARVRSAGVYPGVDLVYYGHQQQLEYDFIVAPGASPQPIRLRFSGVTRLQLESEGNLQVIAAKGSITFHKPLLYQSFGEKRVEVPGAFRLAANNSVQFTVGAYDHTRALVIDPVLVYSTYLGGSLNDQANGIALDADGSAYLVGQAQSSDFPVTAAAYQVQHPGATSGNPNVAFVSKFNAAGTALVYSTYLGGTGGDYGYGIALDAQKNAYITGETASSDFPTTCGVFQAKNYSASGAAGTAFVAKLSPSGDALLYSTYLGGTGNGDHGDAAQAIAVDDEGNALITGYSASVDFPTTHGAFQTQFKATSDNSNAFVAKLSPDATALVYSTFLGGTGSTGRGDYGFAIAIDAAGDAFIAGSTASTDFPVTSGAFQSRNKSAVEPDTVLRSTAFVTELNPAGDKLVYSTFLGGSYGDYATAIALGADGSAYVAGSTYSTDFPVTSGVFEGTDYSNYAYDGHIGFLGKIDPAGSALTYATYLGGAFYRGTDLTGLAVDAAGVAYVTGTAELQVFPSTPDTLPTPTSPNTVAFLLKLNSNATALNYFTYLGSTAADSHEQSSGTGVAVDGTGNVYVAGFTDWPGFPTTDGAFQTVNHAAVTHGNNAFVSKLALASETTDTPAGPVPQPPFKVSTSIFEVDGGFSWIDCPNTYSIGFTAYLSTDDGLVPTGTVTFSSDAPGSAVGTVYPDYSSGSGGGVASGGYNGSGGVSEGEILGVYADYSGDRYYAPSGGGDASGPYVPYCDELSSRSAPQSTVHKKIALNAPGSTQSGKRAMLRRKITASGVGVFGLKFRHPATASLQRNGSLRSGKAGKAAKAVASRTQDGSCVLPRLIVYLHPLLRPYGAPNSTGTAVFFPSRNANTLTVNETLITDASSPVGVYPVTATVTGPGADRYSSIQVIPTTLQIKPAPLLVLARSHSVRYGQAPAQLTGFSLFGFRNGDTLGVVTGAPDLSTSVTPATPVGYYPIQIAPGTLAAQNYFFEAPAHHGVIHVAKAILTVTANDVTIHAGDPLPAFTYTATGFVNGDTLPSSVTGTPQLSTSASAHSGPGTFPIYVSTYPMKSGSYDFTGVNGKLTILP